MLIKNNTKVNIVNLPGVEGYTGKVVGIAQDFSPIYVMYIVELDKRSDLVEYDCILMHSSNLEVIQDIQYPMLDINDPTGTKVIFDRPNSGWEYDKVYTKDNLTIGETYTVNYIDVGSFTSYVNLKEHPDKTFNTVCFSVVK